MDQLIEIYRDIAREHPSLATAGLGLLILCLNITVQLWLRRGSNISKLSPLGMQLYTLLTGPTSSKVERSVASDHVQIYDLENGQNRVYIDAKGHGIGRAYIMINGEFIKLPRRDHRVLCKAAYQLCKARAAERTAAIEKDATRTVDKLLTLSIQQEANRA